MARQGPGDRRALHLATGKLGRQMAKTMAQTDPPEKLLPLLLEPASPFQYDQSRGGSIAASSRFRARSAREADDRTGR